MMSKGAIEIFKTDIGTDIKVVLEKDTVWLDAHLIATLFGVQRPAIVKHISNIYKSEELDKTSTCSKMEQVAADGKKRIMNLYNLDMIISVGYRVNSKRATHFRQWATGRLKDYLVQGYAINTQRFEQNANELEQALRLIKKTAQSPELNTDSGRGLVEIVSRYAQTFLWLQRYDDGLLEEPVGQRGGRLVTADEGMLSLTELKQQLIARVRRQTYLPNLVQMV